MAHSDVHLHWRSERIAKIMADAGIGTRRQLVARLNVSQNTVYRSFTEDWQGIAKMGMLTALAKEFKIPFAQLVVEPFTAIEELI